MHNVISLKNVDGVECTFSIRGFQYMKTSAKELRKLHPVEITSPNLIGKFINCIGNFYLQ